MFEPLMPKRGQINPRIAKTRDLWVVRMGLVHRALDVGLQIHRIIGIIHLIEKNRRKNRV